MPRLTASSPLGPITLVEEDGAIVALEWDGNGADQTPLLVKAHTQLAEYFAKERQEFDLPLAPKGSPALLRFLDALRKIPFGTTKTYGEMAKETGLSAQAAGQACGANPIAVLIPCHRVVAAKDLGGFSAKGGIEAKKMLLRLEGVTDSLRLDPPQNAIRDLFAD